MTITMNELRKQFIDLLREYDTPQSAIDFLSNDIHTLLWIEHCRINEKMTLNQLFGDAGFHEFLHMQFANPITFDEMG